MSDKTASSSLAIVEHRKTKPGQQRPVGGCAGIFFQLFDWNRKKLFSKKLLPPVRFKQASNKFVGDEKHPKLRRLIADENTGGFPTSTSSSSMTKKSNVDFEMRSPSLIARLMGLEAIPTVSSKQKTLASKKIRLDDEKDKCVVDTNSSSSNNVFGYMTSGDLNNVVEKSRPEKLQKRSSDYCEVVRQGNLPFKNVLSKSRKSHHPKLPSPVKSPRNSSRRSKDKLIGAATRILEPGLQMSRSKCAIGYSNKGKDSDVFGNVASKEEEQPSCRNCGHFVETVLDSESSLGEKPLIFGSSFPHCVGDSCRELERSKARKDVPLTPSSDHNNQSQNRDQMFRARDTFPPLSKFHRVPPSNKVSTAVNERNKFVSGKFEPEKRIADRQNEMMPSGRKRRPTANMSRQVETSGLIGSDVQNQKYDFHHGMYGKELGYNGSNRNGLPHLRERAVRGGTREVVKRRVQNDSSDSLCKSALLSEKVGNDRVDKPLLTLSGDALGAILEQKLKELNCQGEDIMGNAPKKSTATILQELISALTLEVPFQEDKPVTMYDGKSHIHNHSHLLSNSTPSHDLQPNAMSVKLSVDPSLESEHLSPGSVLESHFSNESCHSSSLGDSLGYKMLNESVDSAKKINSAKTSRDFVINLLDDVSKTLANFDLKEIELDQAKRLLLNAELADIPVNCLLFDELETLASLLWMNFGCSLGIEDGKEVNHLKTFTFNSIIEYLDVRIGSKSWAKLPFCINSSNMLILEIVKQVKRWDGLSRFVHDELIEREMSLSLGKWTQFESESFETGIEISKHVFHFLMDEIISEFC